MQIRCTHRVGGGGSEGSSRNRVTSGGKQVSNSVMYRIHWFSLALFWAVCVFFVGGALPL
jgi:hypothetical protein